MGKLLTYLLLFLYIHLEYFIISFALATGPFNTTAITPKCDVPTETDPFDKSILPLIGKRTPTKCHNNFFYAELDLKTGIIEPNFSKIKSNSCACKWNALKIITRTFDRNQFVFTEFQPFKSPIHMEELKEKKNSDLVLVKCRCSQSRTEKLFSYPNFKLDNRKQNAPIQLDKNVDKVEIENGTKKCPVAPNVIVMVIESLSYLNFKRHMKKTQSLFEQDFNSTMVEFKSVIKMGENSYQNMITLITGIPYWQLRRSNGEYEI